MKGIEPICLGSIMIAENANEQTYTKNKKCQQNIFCYPLIKDTLWDQFRFFMFEHMVAV